MAYSRSYQLTDSEKRLKVIREQLYGKDRPFTIKSKPENPESEGNSSQHTSFKINPGNPSTSRGTSTLTGDLSYLQKDLGKITILGAMAIVFQILLYLGLQKNIINLNF